MSIDYKRAGVDVEAGDAFVEWIQKSQPSQSPFSDKIISGVGGFASIFKLNFPKIKNPCLVSATDGVGTKVKLAAQYENYSGVGQDLVAMCVNDLICCGAQPLFFLDYYATGKLDMKAAQAFLKSVRDACHESGCALIGGETAEMPGVYHEKDFDCAGFAVGIVDEHETLGPHRVRLGDECIGVASSGFHSNGYSLLRKLFAEDLDAWKDLLLRPTKLYPKLVMGLYEARKLNAVAHITGGGMENLPRVLPVGTEVKLKHWDWPSEFTEVQKRSGMSRTEMLKTLNCGIGLVMIVDPGLAGEVEEACEKLGHKTYRIGTVDAGSDLTKEAQVVY